MMWVGSMRNPLVGLTAQEQTNKRPNDNMGKHGDAKRWNDDSMNRWNDQNDATKRRMIKRGNDETVEW